MPPNVVGNNTAFVVLIFNSGFIDKALLNALAHRFVIIGALFLVEMFDWDKCARWWNLFVYRTFSREYS